MTPVELKPFDPDAQARITALFRTCPPSQFLSELDAYLPRSGQEALTFHKFRGWALYDSGEYRRSRPSLMRALRLTKSGSNDRSLVHGLIAESYLRVGQFDRAERCTRRALSEGCQKDADHFLQAGHLLALGRIQGLAGHVTHAIETLSRALSLINEANPHWISILIAIAENHLRRGHVAEAEAAIEQARHGQEGGKQQDWGIVTVECPMAIDLGDIAHAEQVTDEALALFFDRTGERIQLLLTELRASVLHARERYVEAEQLLRGILDQTALDGRASDMVAPAARRLTESLMAQGLYEEAVDAASVASRAGLLDDRGEWVTALRLKAECLHRLGAGERTRHAFREAMSAHDCTQFDVERARVERSIQNAFRPSVIPSGTTVRTRKLAEVRRLCLLSGRMFLTCDDRLIEAIRAAAFSNLPVLIEGETGTGKELVANLIHEWGPRSLGPMTVVDCTTLPESLADAELFGAARGAYTGALQERAGMIAQADGGTLLLDELPELQPHLQAKLLRVIQEGTYRRIGEDLTRRVATRFVAATNRNAQHLMNSGALKPDLFYRLCGHRIVLRPLRSRREEIAPLADEIARDAGAGGIASDAIEWLESHAWPGNVRQMEMVMRLAAACARPGARIRRSDLESQTCAPENSVTLLGAGTNGQPETTLLGNRRAAERVALEKALADHRGVITDAARALGISRQAFYKAMDRAGIGKSRQV